MLLSEYDLEACFYEIDDEEKEDVVQSQVLAAEAISTYFYGKTNRDLITPGNLKILMESNMASATTEVYDILGPDSPDEKYLVETCGDIYTSIKKVLAVLDECANLRIREEYIPGILVLHFREAA